MNEAGEVTQEIMDRAKFRFSDMQLHGLAALVYAGFVLLQSMLPRFSTSHIVLAVWFAGAGLAWLYFKRTRHGENDLRVVKVDETGVVGITFRGGKLDFAWSEISLVRFSDADTAGTGFIEVEGRGLHAVIRQEFLPQYPLIRDLVQRRCEEKHVKFEQRSLEEVAPETTAIRSAQTIVADRASFEPRKIFRFVMLGAYGILLVVLLATWGELTGGVAVFVFWVFLIAAWVYGPGLLPTKWLKVIEITEAGFYCETFAGKKKEIPWENVREVAVTFPIPGKGGQPGRVVVFGKGGPIRIGSHFKRFGSIIVEVSEACGKRGIKVETTGPAPAEDNSQKANEDENTV